MHFLIKALFFILFSCTSCFSMPKKIVDKENSGLSPQKFSIYYANKDAEICYLFKAAKNEEINLRNRLSYAEQLINLSRSSYNVIYEIIGLYVKGALLYQMNLKEKAIYSFQASVVQADRHFQHSLCCHLYLKVASILQDPQIKNKLIEYALSNAFILNDVDLQKKIIETCG